MAQVVINGISFKPHPLANYRHDYEKFFDHTEGLSAWQKLEYHREFLLTDLWYFVYFGMRVRIANHPHWVQMCREVEELPESHVLYLWFREGGKSTIITVARNIQRALRRKAFDNFDERIAILSYTRDLAQDFLLSIQQILEQSTYLQYHFPDILYPEPRKDASNWSLDKGLYLQRADYSIKEGTFEAWGLIDGQPTGRHFTKITYDDIMTEEMSNSEKMCERAKTSFDMSLNLGSSDPTEDTSSVHEVVGTFYRHDDVLVYLSQKRKPNGEMFYKLHKVAATYDGTIHGVSRYHPEAKMDELRLNPRMFYTQQLLDPTPQGSRRLNSDHIVMVDADEIPKENWEFMTIDPAGVRKDGRGDRWGICVAGVVPYRNQLGMSDVYIKELIIRTMSLEEAQELICRLAMRFRRLRKVGVEKVAASTWEIHVARALMAKQIPITRDNGRLVILAPEGRSKEWRIENNLSVPLPHGKIHLSRSVAVEDREAFFGEMKSFPYGHDDGLDAASYIYDLIKDYTFGEWEEDLEEEESTDGYDAKEEKEEQDSENWMTS